MVRFISLGMFLEIQDQTRAIVVGITWYRCVAAFLLSCACAGFAQSSTTAEWSRRNQFAEVNLGSYLQNYREHDLSGRTAGGILDSESGRQSHLAARLRWQFDSGWLIQLQADRQSGPTNYDGHLQSSGGALTPYRARSGNAAWQTSAGLGYAINRNKWATMPEALQITPLLQLGKHQWHRHLVQYSETYDYVSVVAGALVQWQAGPGTRLEGQALSGRARDASVHVPQLGFVASQPGGRWQEWQVGIQQQLSSLSGVEYLAGWNATVRYTRGRYQHGASTVNNGLQAPSNEHRPSSWLLGVQKQF